MHEFIISVAQFRLNDNCVMKYKLVFLSLLDRTCWYGYIVRYSTFHCVLICRFFFCSSAVAVFLYSCSFVLFSLIPFCLVAYVVSVMRVLPILTPCV